MEVINIILTNLGSLYINYLGAIIGVILGFGALSLAISVVKHS